MTFGLYAYKALTGAVSPALPILLRGRVKRGKEDPNRLQERMGFASRRRPEGKLVWLHGASIGESQVLLQLFEALQEQHPELQGLITTQTLTSADLIARKSVDGLIHQMAPLDSPFAISRFIRHWHPDAAVFAEGDIWPNMLTRLDQKRIPRLLVNARMTEKSFSGWMRFKGLANKLFGGFLAIHAANQKTGDWLKVFSRNRAKYTGNIKHSAPPLSVDPVELERLRAVIGNRPVLAAISTHPGEEDLVLAAFDELKASCPTPPLLIIAPRHPERAGELLSSALETRAVYQRSKDPSPLPEQDIWLCDTLGEIGLWMTLSKIVFLGGGQPGADIHGHNPIEALKLDRFVISQSDVANFKQEFADLVAANAAEIVETPDEIAKTALPFMTGEKQLQADRARLNAYLIGDAPLIQARNAVLRALKIRPEE